jgi:small GTP-binding protein
LLGNKSMLMPSTDHQSPLIAFFGLPNSGKSTLINRVTSSKVAIVAREKHTTRDLNFGETEWDGLYMRFVDTGGLVPNPADIIQKEIQIKSWSALLEADILVWVIDKKQNPDTISEAITKKVWSLGKPFIVCINKVDDPNNSVPIQEYARLGGFDFVNISSNNGLGVDVLLDSLLEKSLQLGFSKIQNKDVPFILSEKAPKRKKSKKLEVDGDGKYIISRENSESGPGMFYSQDITEAQIVNPIKNIVVDFDKTLFFPGSGTDKNLGLSLFLQTQKDLGKKIFYLCENADELLRERVNNFPGLFDGGFAATSKRLDKTNPEFYKEFLQHYDLNPQETIFFDDGYENIQIAKGLGVFSEQFFFDKTDPAEFLQQAEIGVISNDPKEPLSIIFLGKPNVGKSSLYNWIFGQDLQIVSDVPGTTLSVNDREFTRDLQYKYKDSSGEVLFNVPFQNEYRILDTTGLRKPGGRTMGVESFASFRTIESAHRADIVCFVLDCSSPITHQDQVVAGICQDVGRGVVLVLNKVDLISPEERKKFLDNFNRSFGFLKIDNIVFTSSKENIGLLDFWEKVDRAKDDQSRYIPKEELRKLFNYLMKKKPPNKLRNQKKAVIYDLVFKSSNPPVFELLVKNKKAIHWSWIRFLENTIRRQFHFLASGIKVKITEVDRRKIDT